MTITINNKQMISKWTIVELCHNKQTKKQSNKLENNKKRNQLTTQENTSTNLMNFIYFRKKEWTINEWLY